VQFERQARLPLRVGHLKQVDLRHSARYVEERVDSTERGQSLADHGLCGRGRSEIKIDHERFCPRGLHRFRRALQIRPVPRDENERGEVARKANGCRPADSLARAGNDRD
jgi:hypothetical protein